MIPLFKVLMTPVAIAAAQRVLGSGYVGQGAEVDGFERRLQAVLDSPDPVLTVNSGTTALDLALRLAGVRPGDEIITTPQTCTATNCPIVTQGAIPVWADIDPLTGLIDPASVARLVTPKTRAIMAVDWAGRVCDYPALKALGLPVIEDAAHAFLATRDGASITRAGGDYVCWSFQAIKHLTTVDGGLLRCPPAQIERARLLRWYGFDRTSSADFRCAQNVQEVGFKYHLHDVAAAIGAGNLNAAVSAVTRHRDNAAFYGTALQGVPGVTVPPPDFESAWWIYPLLVSDRASFTTWMTEHGIATSPVHARNDTHDAFRRAARQPVPLPGVDAYAAHEVAIPVGWWVTDADRARIAAEVVRWSTTN